eukprot:1016931-Prymnesium_polylepis.1
MHPRQGSAGPTPDELVDKGVLAGVKFDPTAEGMQVMAITFPAALGTMYAQFLNNRLKTKDFILRTTRE